MAILEIESRGETKVVHFIGPRMTIGRQEDNDVVLAEPVASRRHCVIELDGGRFKLRDLQSANGTWLGDVKVRDAILVPGDKLRIGNTTIRLVAEKGELPSQEIEGEDDAAELIETTTESEESVEADVRSGKQPYTLRSKPKPALAKATARVPASPRAPVRPMMTGPLARQLAPLLEACMDLPMPEGVPEVARDIKLLIGKNQELAADKKANSSSTEALDSLRQLLLVAFRSRSTDIHIEPKGAVYLMRFRIDGLMHSIGEVSSKIGTAILNIIKLLCELDIAKRSIVQEGSFAVELPMRRVDFRINFTPTMYGQKLAVRILDKGAIPLQFENLGMDLDAAAELQRICGQDSGMIILAGPTGSGKTTTLYTALQNIDANTRNIVTIEDPVEYELPSTTQISVDPIHHVTFASVLSSVLRQDPDIILVGEVRDEDTARMAMQAATTGHLVLTTLHARDTVGTVFRLLDLGVEPFLVANAVTLCISQRLVRVLCHFCKKPYKPDAELLRRTKLSDRPHGDFYEAVGCKKCLGVGYRGRIAVFEILLFTPQVRDVILSKPTIADIRRAAGEWMSNTLVESGYRRVIEGVTTVEEVDRVAGMA